MEEILHVGQIVLSIRLSASVKAESMHDLSAPEFYRKSWRRRVNTTYFTPKAEESSTAFKTNDYRMKGSSKAPR